MDPRPWLAHYDAGVPQSLAPYPDATLLDLVAETTRQRPAQTALVFKGARTSFAELSRLSDAFAQALVELGVKKGDRVALLLPNCPQFLVAELGAWKAGAIVTPLNPIYTEAELKGPLVTTGAETIVTLTPFYGRVKSVQRETGLKRVIATNIKEHLPWHLRLLFTLFKEKKEGHRIELRDGDLSFADLLARHAGARPAVQAAPGDTALILMSGGTTGTPKGVFTSHRNLLATGLQASCWIRAVVDEWNDAFLLPLPLFHAAGGVLCLATVLVGHLPLILIPNPRDVSDLVATIAKLRPAFFGGVPTLFNALLNHPEVRSGRADFSSVKLCFCGAAPLMAETKKRFEELTGGRIIEVYSLTEATVAMIGNPVRGANKLGSVGMPAPDIEIRIAEPEAPDTPLATGAVGEILLRAPQVMDGYWNNPEETALALQRHGGELWLHTGDLGYLDADGYLFLVDRMKDLMKPSGMQVWPREVEEVLAAHPAVAEVGVAGVPDPARGEAVKAWVVLRPGATAAAEELRAWCKERLAPYKVPSQVEFRQELPKSLVGKILRRVLAQEERARLAAAAS